MPTNGAPSQDTEWNAPKLVKVLAVPCFHVLHGREDLGLERLKQARLL